MPRGCIQEHRLSEEEVGVNGEHLSQLIFANDIVWFSKSAEDLQRMLSELHTQSTAYG